LRIECIFSVIDLNQRKLYSPNSSAVDFGSEAPKKGALKNEKDSQETVGYRTHPRRRKGLNLWLLRQHADYQMNPLNA
jgi:hypothetical protein